MQPRPPIVAVMGHVDHGKTTLLDHIRKTSVAGREAGGITQSIGAYEITHAGKKITFIDTPGHEAFSKMREYGAKVADLAILIVAAEDSVKPQTKDALRYILQEGIPYVVAINKIDKNSANVEKVKQDLTQAGVFLEGFGGTVSWNAISAKTGQGVHELLDHLLLVAEVEGFSYNPAATPAGVVISCRRDPQRGVAVGIVVQNGVLMQDMPIATETASGKVRILEDANGTRADRLEPSAPALVVGFDAIPRIGELFTAGEGTTMYPAQKPAARVRAATHATEGEAEQLRVILKADEVASLEALEGVVGKLAVKLPITIVEGSIGNVHETDVKTAESSRAVIVGFRIKPDRAAENIAHAKKVTVITSAVIYELERMLTEFAEKLIAKEVRAIEVLATFGQAKGKQRVVGGRVTLGPIRNQEPFEIWQDQRLIGSGKILNLQSQRADVPEAQAGIEVGLLVETDEPIKVGSRLVFAS